MFSKSRSVPAVDAESETAFSKKMRPFRSRKAFQIPCVHRFRHVRFGRQIRYLALFLAGWNWPGLKARAPSFKRDRLTRQSLNADTCGCFTQPQCCRITKVA